MVVRLAALGKRGLGRHPMAFVQAFLGDVAGRVQASLATGAGRRARVPHAGPIAPAPPPLLLFAGLVDREQVKVVDYDRPLPPPSAARRWMRRLRQVATLT